MHDSPNTLKSRIIRIASYIFVVIFVATGTYYLANYAQGILINPTTGDTTQNGLTIIQSKPVNADVSIDNQPLDERTPTRQILPIGTHTVRLSADKYRPWAKSFNINGSDIVWLDYPLLIPQDISTTKDAVFGNKPVIAASNNRRLLAASDATETIKLFNIANKETTESEITLPDNLIVSLGKNASLKTLKFAANDRYLLAEYKSGKSTKFLRIDRENPDQTINLNDLFNLDFVKVTFDEDGNFNDFYGQVDNKLYSLDVPDMATKEIAIDVKMFYSFKNMIFTIATKPNNPGVVQISYTENNEKPRTIAEIKADKIKRYDLVVQQFKSRINLAITLDGETSVYKNVQQKARRKPIKINLKTTQQQFSSNGRFLAITDGMTVEMFDIEFDHHFSFSISKKPASIRWMDNFRLTTVSSGMARLVDFDGNNNQPIAEASPSFIPVANQNNESLITMTKDTSRYVLGRSRLQIE